MAYNYTFACPIHGRNSTTCPQCNKQVCVWCVFGICNGCGFNITNIITTPSGTGASWYLVTPNQIKPQSVEEKKETYEDRMMREYGTLY